MMSRSTPPRSANFAEMPVPAPAPITGLPLATTDSSLSSVSDRLNFMLRVDTRGTT